MTQHGLSFYEISDGILKIDYRERESLNKIADVIQFDYGHYLREKQPYLTSDQLNKLIA